VYAGTADPGWLGTHSRLTDTQNADTRRQLIHMSQRPYNPYTGRFLTTDPIEAGTGPSGYTYPNDPINGHDISGRLVGLLDLSLAIQIAIFAQRAEEEARAAWEQWAATHPDAGQNAGNPNSYDPRYAGGPQSRTGNLDGKGPVNATRGVQKFCAVASAVSVVPPTNLNPSAWTTYARNFGISEATTRGLIRLGATGAKVLSTYVTAFASANDFVCRLLD
jgi:RHS repeat-associated protein